MADALYRGLSRPEWLRPGVDGVRDGVSMTHAKLLELTRDTKKTLYVVSAAYVVVGFILAVVCLATGQLLGTFLGFLIISGTLGAAAVLRAVLRIGVRVSAITDGLDDISKRLDRIEAVLKSLNRSGAGEVEAVSEPDVGSPQSQAVRGVLDLARVRTAEPEAITAASLDRGVFPRLVSLLEHESTQEEHDTENNAAGSLDSSGHPVGGERRSTSDSVAGTHPEDVVQTEDVDGSAAKDGPMSELEQSLRRSIADCVQRRDVAGLLELTEQVLEQLPDHPMAQECRRLQPQLRQALANDDDDGSSFEPPSSRYFHGCHVAQATP